MFIQIHVFLDSELFIEEIGVISLWEMVSCTLLSKLENVYTALNTSGGIFLMEI